VTKKKIPELKIEQINERANLHFLALLEYKREIYLCIVDQVTPTEIGAYVLDFAEQENIPVQEFLSVATQWFYGKSDAHPLSVEIARQGLTEKCAPLYRTFDTTYVARIVGQAFTYGGVNKSKVRRRRVIPIPEGVAIRLKRPIAVE
jgi:hypothetical protein